MHVVSNKLGYETSKTSQLTAVTDITQPVDNPIKLRARDSVEVYNFVSL